MPELRLAGNLIQGLPGPFGHLQIVYVQGSSLVEVEVGRPDDPLAIGRFQYPVVQDHTHPDNTSNYNVAGEYASVVLDLGVRDPEIVWNTLRSIHQHFATQGGDVGYFPLSQNSNSYVNTLLWMIGIELSDYVDGATPADVNWFPGENTNVLFSLSLAQEPIEFELIDTEGASGVVRTGFGADVLVGGDGTDSLFSGDGDDFLFGGSRDGFEYVIGASNQPQFGVLPPPPPPPDGPPSNFTNWDDGERDYLVGSAGYDHYFVATGTGEFFPTAARSSAIYESLDIINDYDGQGVIYAAVDDVEGVSVWYTEYGGTFTFDQSWTDYFGVTTYFNDNNGQFAFVERWTNPETGVTRDLVVGAIDFELYQGVFGLENYSYGSMGVWLAGYQPGEITGSSTNDQIQGTIDDDVIRGGDGDDTIAGGAGSDIVDGQAGSDIVDYSASAAGVDVDFTTGTISGGDAEGDTLISIEGVIGSNNAGDRLVGSALGGSYFGLGGDDLIIATGGTNTLDGGLGNDTIVGGTGDDAIYDSMGTNSISGGAGIDTYFIDGPRAEFQLSVLSPTLLSIVGSGIDSLVEDVEILFFQEAGGVVEVVNVADLASQGPNVIEGTAGDDTLTGTDGDDLMLGLGGQDTFFSSLGNDTFDGGDPGYNQVDYDGVPGDYVFTLNGNGSVTVENPTYGTDTLIDIEGVWFRGEPGWYALDTLLQGSSGVITGTAGDDYLTGTAGNDVFDGLGGQDTFYGGLGNDTYNGGDRDTIRSTITALLPTIPSRAISMAV